MKVLKNAVATNELDKLFIAGYLGRTWSPSTCTCY